MCNQFEAQKVYFYYACIKGDVIGFMTSPCRVERNRLIHRCKDILWYAYLTNLFSYLYSTSFALICVCSSNPILKYVKIMHNHAPKFPTFLVRQPINEVFRDCHHLRSILHLEWAIVKYLGRVCPCAIAFISAIYFLNILHAFARVVRHTT